MSMERRRNGREYFYFARCEGNRVLKTYVGTGEKARRAAEEVERARAARVEAKRLRAEQHRPLEELAANLDKLGTVLDGLVECHLICGGWRRHHGQWRRPKHV